MLKSAKTNVLQQAIVWTIFAVATTLRATQYETATATATTSDATSGIGLRQHVSASIATATASSAVFSEDNVAGNWIAVVVRGGATGQAFAVTDSRGNSYRPAVRFDVTADSPSGNTLGIYYAENIAAGTNTVTVSQSTPATLRFAIFEYSGVATTNSLDVTAAAQGVGESPDSGVLTTTTGGELLLGAVATAQAVTAMPGPGYTMRERVSSEPDAKLFVEDGIQPSAGAMSASMILGTADAWGIVAASFRPASSVISPSDLVPPSATGALTANALSRTEVSLVWDAATDNVGVTGYRLSRCQGSGCSNFKFQASVVDTSYVDTSVLPNASYTYQVRAVDAAGNLGPLSNPASVMTPGLTTGLVAAYSFEEGAGTAVLDSSGNGNNGTLVNAVWSNSGRYGRALAFNGTNARVRVNDSPALRLSTGMTLEAWVNPSTGSDAWRDVIYKGDDNYFLEASSPNGSRPASGWTVAAGPSLIYGAERLATNAWTHVAATYDGSRMRLFVNGNEVSSTAQTGLLAAGSSNPLEIGGDSIYGQFFQGLIDEVRIYNIALTQSEIQADMGSSASLSFPIISLSTAAVDFGSQSVGTSSIGRTVTLTNTGGVTLSISEITLSGLQAGDFGQTNTCAGPVPPSGTCTIVVVFTPTMSGGRSATITISGDASGDPNVITLAGFGTNDFSIGPRTAVLTPSRTQQFTVGNGENVTWSVDGITGGTEQSGTITQTGLYTSPTTGGRHTVTAAAIQTSESSNATVYVTTYPGTFTHHNDNFRTGQNLQETVLTPANVNSASFGKLFTASLDGMAIASPLYVAGVSIPGVGTRNVVYVATEHNTIYAFDADGPGNGPLWQRSFIDSAAGVTTVPASDTGECCDISPEIGITGTPVIDESSGTLYVVAKTKENGAYVQRLHALDIASSAEKYGGPVAVQGTVPGSGIGNVNGGIAFNALRQNQRPALLLANGVVYVAFGSHGDNQPYHGWLLAYDARTLERVMTFNATPNGEGGGIWQANGGPAADAAGNVYFVTGDGSFDANLPGGKNYGDSFVGLTPSGTVRDYFTPHDQANIDINDFDLGAAGPLLLPDQPGAHPHLMVSAGKNGAIYVVDRDNMGLHNPNSDSQIVQSLPGVFQRGQLPTPGNYSAPVYFNGNVYFGPVSDSVQSFQLTDGLLSTTPTSFTTEAFAYPGASMAVSADGISSGILWAIQRRGDCGVLPACATASPGVLRAYDPANLAIELYNSDQAGPRDTLDYATKFSVPLVANGRVYVASMTKLTVYGLLP